jgi:hypothetical protein
MFQARATAARCAGPSNAVPVALVEDSLIARFV